MYICTCWLWWEGRGVGFEKLIQKFGFISPLCTIVLGCFGEVAPSLNWITFRSLRGKAHGPMDASLLMQRFPNYPNFKSSILLKTFCPMKSLTDNVGKPFCLATLSHRRQMLFKTTVVLSCPEVSICHLFGDIYWTFPAFISSYRWAFMIFIDLLKLSYSFIWWRKFAVHCAHSQSDLCFHK